MLNELRRVDPEIYNAIRDEVRRQHVHLELIASENYVSQAVLDAQGSVLTNKYAEGYPGKRYYGGCEYVDVPEVLAVARAKKIFGTEHANVQPHSGTQANMAVYFAMLEPGDKILGMDLNQGGHLSHGNPKNFSGRIFQTSFYGVDRDTEMINIETVRKVAHEVKPRLIITGASAYSRSIDFAAFREVADEVGAYLMADIAHIAGLVAAGLHPDPVPFCEVVTTTTHKTMRGPRGGIILCRKKFASAIDSQVFPGMQGGPLMHVIAAKAVALQEALEPAFALYQKRILENAKALCSGLQELGYRIVAGGTDNHMMLVDLRSRNISGADATELLGRAGITVNKNLVPFDPLPPTQTSGIRVGSPALTTRGMGPKDMRYVAGLMDRVLVSKGDNQVISRVREEVLDLCDRFPIYVGTMRRLFEQERGAYDLPSPE
ncbi:MAG TPA: serine hydroxymethyltransferase [Planctomycetes bacterium]|nr:serine hydroxymethyltransferase [Planctomycetota bacterium]